MARFERTDLSRLRSRRRRIERRIERLTHRIQTDPLANLPTLAAERDRLYDVASGLTAQIAAELHADERRRLRQELLAARG